MTDVRWGDPLEAVHTDGRVMPVTRVGEPDRAGDYTTMPSIEGAGGIWHADGTAWGTDLSKRSHLTEWRIRNVAAPAWRTSDEQLDRMDALVKRLAAHQNDTWWTEAIATRQEAHDILAAREPIDPRFEKALAGVIRGMPQLADSTARRLARDVLAALDA